LRPDPLEIYDPAAFSVFARLRDPGDLKAFLYNCDLALVKISRRPVVEAALSTVSPAW